MNINRNIPVFMRINRAVIAIAHVPWTALPESVRRIVSKRLIAMV
jgi:hypothetical protein